MEIIIDIDDDIPLFKQLMNQIKKTVQDGTLVSGDPLPSIRQLANDLDLNNKTVAKAYRLLERDEVIVPRGYRGTFIHECALKNSTGDLNAWVNEELARTIKKIKASGATESEIRIAFADVLNSGKTNK